MITHQQTFAHMNSYQQHMDRLMQRLPDGDELPVFQTFVGSKKRSVVECVRGVFVGVNDCVQKSSCLSEEVASSLRTRLYDCMSNMFMSEVSAAHEDKFAFYVTTSTDMKLYEFNTLLLKMSGHVDGKTLICTPSVLDSAYEAENMASLMSKFKSGEICHDLEDLCQETILSANCTLLPEGYDRGFHHISLRPAVEAAPTRFAKGGFVNERSDKIMLETMETVLGMSSDVAGVTLDRVNKLYSAYYVSPNDKDFSVGHCVQLLIPKPALMQSTYLCVAYGAPVEVVETPTGTLQAQAVVCTPSMLRTDTYIVDGIAVPMDTFLTLHPQLSHLQARIIAHPTLFIQHGVEAVVESANPNYDRDRFQRELEVLLEPYAGKVVIGLKKFGRVE